MSAELHDSRRTPVERAAAALRRRRRRGDERIRARGARARRAGERLRSARLPLRRALAGRRCAARRGSASTTPRTCRTGEGVEVVYSSAVPPENPERAAARERGLPERPRAELLGELTALRRTIAVAGTHGKTTTASMIVHALRAAGMRPDWLVGGAGGGGTGQRAVGRRGRVAGGRGRRVRPLDAESGCRDRGADERGARSPRDVRLAGGAARGVSRVPGTGAKRRSSCGIGPSWSRCAGTRARPRSV